MFWFVLGVSHSPGRGPPPSAAGVLSPRTLHSPLAALGPLPFQLILFLDDEGLPSATGVLFFIVKRCNPEASFCFVDRVGRSA